MSIEEIKKGDVILIKVPTKRNPSRLIEAYARSIFEPPGKKRRLVLIGANRRKYNIFEDHPSIVCKLDAGSSDSLYVELEKTK